MDTPIYPVAVTVGGPNQTTSSGLGKVLPKVINTRQSGSIVATFTDADAAAFDISGLSGLDVKAKPYNTSETPVTLGTGVVSGVGNNIFTVSWVRDLFPAGWSSYASDREGAIVIYIELEETGTADYYQWDTRVNVEDGDYTGDASTLPLVNLVFYDNQVYEYDNTTTEADPTAGKFRLNNATLASVTEMYIADDNKSGVDMQTFWQSLASGSDIYMATATSQNNAVYFTVSGAPTNNVGYTKIPLTYVSEGTTQLTNGSYMSLLVNKLASVTYSDGESINDNNGNELIQFGVVGSAVNEVKITNAATGNGPIIAPAGETNIDLNVNATGTGVIKAGSNLDLNGNTLLAPSLGAPLDTNSHQINLSKGADVASASSLVLGTDGNYFDITGTTTITSIATLGIGTQVTLHFDGALTLTHHATDLILPSGANVTTAAGDEFTFVEYASGDWRCIGYVLASGEAIVGGAGGGGNFNNQTGTTYTLVLADGDGVTTVTMNNASANTLTIPTNASVAIGTDVAIAVMQYGAGSTTISGDTGVTVNGVSGGSVEIGTQYSGAVLTKTATDTWVVTAGSSQKYQYLGTSGAISSAASVEFTTAGWFDGTYEKIIFLFHNVLPVTNSVNFLLTASTDGGSSYLAGTNYQFATQVRNAGGSGGNAQSTGSSQIQLNGSDTIGNATNEFVTGELSLFNPLLSAYKRCTYHVTAGATTGNLLNITGGGEIKTTSAVNAIKFAMSSGNISSGEILVYGVTV